MMCSANDDPTTYDIPEPIAPRVYRLSGDRPEPIVGRGSVALAVLGEMLNDAEKEYDEEPLNPTRETAFVVLRRARDRVAEAESRDR